MPITGELRLLYFSSAIQASIHNPRTLALHIAFDDGIDKYASRTIAFSRREENVWQAEFRYNRCSTIVRDRLGGDLETKQAEYQQRKVFRRYCFAAFDGDGRKNRIEYEARSFEGWLETYGIRSEPADRSQSMKTLEDFIDPPDRGGSLLNWLWIYKYKLAGETEDARDGADR